LNKPLKNQSYDELLISKYKTEAEIKELESRLKGRKIRIARIHKLIDEKMGFKLGIAPPVDQRYGRATNCK